MKTLLNANESCQITEANINFYSTPFIHPSRKMSELDFIYMIDGKWKFGQNEEVFEMQNDTVLLLSATQRHYGISPCRANSKTMYFHVRCSSIENEDAILLDSFTDVSSNKNIKKLFSEIVNAKLLNNDKKANIYFQLFLLELQEHQNNLSFGSIPSQIKKIIHDHPEKFFSNQELATAVNCSKKIAEMKFKDAFGISIHKYTLEFKVKEAISYFNIFPEISIKETALNLGFYDEYHFSNQFKKIIGVSPKKYKSRHFEK